MILSPIRAPRRGMKKLLCAGLFSAAICVATMSTGCSKNAGQSDARPASKIVLFALDAGTWDVIDPLIERGLLPNLARLKAGGTSGALQSIVPSSSPVVWTSVATGKTPEKHGITFFVSFPGGNTGQPEPVSRTMRKGKALWNILSETQREVAVIGWFVTWPAEEVHGVLVSDRAHFEEVKNAIFPPGYLSSVPRATADDVSEAMPEFMAFAFDPEKLDKDSSDPEERLNFLVYDRFVRAYSRDLYYKRVAAQVLSERLPDFLAVYLRGTDDVQHGFWKFMEPDAFEGVTAEQSERFGQVIEEYWRWTDEAVGEILDYYADEDPLILVMSDHGAGPATGEFAIQAPEYLHLSGAHRDQGILIANGPGIRPGATIDGAGVYDITPTILRYWGEPVPRDMDGKVLDGLFNETLAKRPIEWIDTYDDPDDPGPEFRDHPKSAADPKIVDHLKSLGYID